MIADLEELGTLDVSEIHVRRLNAKGLITSMEGEIFIYPIATGTAKLCGRDHEVQESTQRQDQRVMSQDLRKELQGNSERCQPTESQDDAEARDDFWSIKGDFIYRHHIEPRVQLYVPKEESFPIPLKYIDGTRTTHTRPDVLQEKRVNNCWNVDVDRTLSDWWTGFTKCTLLNEKRPTGHMWSGEAPYKVSSNYQTRLSVAWDLDRHVKKQLRRRKSKNGLFRNQSSTTLENWEASVVLIRKMESLKK